MSTGSSRRGFTIAVSMLLVAGALLHAAGAQADHQVVDRISAGPAGGNGPHDVGDFQISADGSRSFFVTAEPLVPHDTDAHDDVYQRAGGTTTLLSTGPAGGNGPFDAGLRAVSDDGTRVLFWTGERLTAGDTDDHLDLYEHSGGTTSLVSVGPAGGNGPFDVASPHQMSADGSAIVFPTMDALTANDTNSHQDLYLRRGGETTLLTGGPVQEAFDSVLVVGISADGERTFFSTTRQLSPNDTDVVDDVYKWEAGSTTMESIGPNGENSATTIHPSGIDADGRRLFFGSFGALMSEDTSSGFAVYERSGETTRLVSVGPSGAVAADASLIGESPDGTHVFFTTTDSLVAADTDSQHDLYVRAMGTTTLVSAGPLAVDEDFQHLLFKGSSSDGSRAFFATFERLTLEDTDGGNSVYEFSGGSSARWLAPALEVGGVSADGDRVFVITDEPLVPGDTDTGCDDADIVGCEDVYEVHAGATTLVSTGPTEPSGGDAGVCRDFSGFRIVVSCHISSSADGTRVLFWHDAPLLAGDNDSRYDVYQANARVGPQRPDYRNAPQFCRAERDFLGEEAFRERYGTSRNGANAFGKCVSSN